MKRSWGIDPMNCGCGGRRKVVAYLTDPKKIREGLEKLGLWTKAAEDRQGAGASADRGVRPAGGV
jgi:hypothetical protein